MNKKRFDLVNALSSFTQIALSVIVPVAIVIFGGKYIVERFSLPSGVMIVFIIFGVVCGFFNMIKYLFMLSSGGNDEKNGE